MIHPNVLGAIGRTPMVRLSRVVPDGCAEVVAKLEYFSPGGSIKDRAALAMIRDAEANGRISRGSTIVEASAGNTGVGLAIVCAVEGYRCLIVLPDSVSSDKLSVLRALGAEVVLARAGAEPSDPDGYIGRAEELARELCAYCPDQFANPANADAHLRTTAEEILAECGGELDAFVACVGTGGTLGGVSRLLRERAPNVRLVGAVPERSACAGPGGQTLVEGVVLDLADCEGQCETPDAVVAVADRDAIRMTLRLAREEAILVGGSSGVAVLAAIEVARELGPGKRVATVLSDTGRNYLSTYFNEAWRKAQAL
jgi:cystathionine beta-synthase